MHREQFQRGGGGAFSEQGNISSGRGTLSEGGEHFPREVTLPVGGEHFQSRGSTSNALGTLPEL